jgi:hypothetical protein
MPKKTNKANTVTLSKTALAAEHKKLIALLRTGTREQQMREAASQAIEAKQYKK